MTRAVGLPQDRKNTAEHLCSPRQHPGRVSGLHSLPLGLQDTDLKHPSPGSLCLMFCGYCMAKMLLWLVYSWLKGS